MHRLQRDSLIPVTWSPQFVKIRATDPRREVPTRRRSSEGKADKPEKDDGSDDNDNDAPESSGRVIAQSLQYEHRVC